MERALVPAAERQIGRRGRNRLRARLAAKVFTLAGTRSTILLDLSQTGARIKADADMIVGQQAILRWAGFEAFGSLVRVEAGTAGMAFDEPLDPAILMATREFDNRDRLPSDLDLDRWRAQEWVEGRRRI